VTQVDGPLSFTPLREDDLPLVAVWRGRPHVARWFHGPLDAAQTREKFLPRISGAEPVRVSIVRCAGEPAGYIQEFRVGDMPRVMAALQVDPEARGLDMLIGDAADTGRGLGTRVVREFSDGLLADARVPLVVIAPDVDNGAAIRCYEKAGFAAVRQVPSTFDDRTNLLMERSRPA